MVSENVLKIICWPKTLKKTCLILKSINTVPVEDRASEITVMAHDDVIKWKHFPLYWPFVMGIHRSPVDSPHKGQWRGPLIFSLICAWTNSWANNRDAGHLRRHCAQYDVTVTRVLVSYAWVRYPISHTKWSKAWLEICLKYCGHREKRKCQVISVNIAIVPWIQSAQHSHNRKLLFKRSLKW